MGTRLQLQTNFETMLGSRNVYFQPPESKKIIYPCVVYRLDDINTRYADNRVYMGKKLYFVQHISTDPDNEFYKKMFELPFCSYQGRTVVDGLYHDNFNLYF